MDTPRGRIDGGSGFDYANRHFNERPEASFYRRLFKATVYAVILSIRIKKACQTKEYAGLGQLSLKWERKQAMIVRRTADNDLATLKFEYEKVLKHNAALDDSLKFLQNKIDETKNRKSQFFKNQQKKAEKVFIAHFALLLYFY